MKDILKHHTFVLSYLLSSTLFTACGGGGGGSENNNSNTNTAPEITGVAASFI